MAEAMAYVEVPGYGLLIPISEVERVVDERDRYREALASIAAWGADSDPRWEHVWGNEVDSDVEMPDAA